MKILTESYQCRCGCGKYVTLKLGRVFAYSPTMEDAVQLGRQIARKLRKRRK